MKLQDMCGKQGPFVISHPVQSRIMNADEKEYGRGGRRGRHD